MSPSQMQNKIVAIFCISDNTSSSLKNITISLSNCSLESEFTETGRQNGSDHDFQNSLKDWDW